MNSDNPADVARLRIAPPKDPKAWARRILDRVDRGFTYPCPLSVQYAREALGLDKDVA